MRALLAFLTLACLGWLPAEDETFPLGTGSTTQAAIGATLPLGSGAPRSIAQAMTAAGWTVVNTTSPSTSTSRITSAWDPYTNAVSVPQGRRQRPLAINGTTYQADLIEGARTTLLAIGTSEHFERWTAGSGSPTVTADTVASPSADSDADSFVEGSANGVQSLAQSITKATSSLAYAGAVYVKNLSGTRKLHLELDDGTTTNGVAAIFDPSAGTLTTAPAAFGSGWSVSTAAGTSGYTIRSIGSGWYRVALTATSDTTATVRFRVALYNGSTTSYAGDAASGVYLWGASVEQATFASSYIAQRNLLLRSEDFTATWGRTRSTATADQLANPLSTVVSADLIVEDNTAGNTHFVSQSAVKPSSSLTMTISVYAKAKERSWILLGAGATSVLANSVGAYFDLTNGVTGSNFSAGAGWSLTSKAIASAGTGWYRCSVVLTTDSTAAIVTVIRLATADTTSSYNGDNASGLYLYGAQTEYGGTMRPYWATSSNGIRNADILVCTMTPSTTAGTILTIAQPRGWTTDIDGGTTVPFTIGSQPTASDAAISTTGSATQFRRNDAVNVLGATVTTNYTDLAWSQVAGTWDANTLNVYLSGVRGTAVTPTTPPYNAVTAFGLGGSGANKFYGYVLALYADHVVPGSDLATIAAGTTVP